MLWTIIGLLFIFWLLGLVFHIGGGIIHILLVIAVIVLIVKLVNEFRYKRPFLRERPFMWRDYKNKTYFDIKNHMLPFQKLL